MRYELTDHEWAAIKSMLPNKPRGVARVNDRRVLNGRGCCGPGIEAAREAEADETEEGQSARSRRSFPRNDRASIARRLINARVASRISSAISGLNSELSSVSLP